MRPWGLPPLPSPDVLAARVPRIAPLPTGTARPFWSVMIPTYNCAAYLRRTLASVLAQDPGVDAMHIEVVDDRSTGDHPEAVVDELGSGRVRFGRNPTNLGPTATFNACLERSLGRWVHLLHGDDMVLPGFYEECRRIIARDPEVVMIVGQVVTIDEEDRWTGVIGPEPMHAGRRFEDFVRRQALAQLAQFAGVVVRRDAYERAGGFCTYFDHVADRDMWFRIGQIGSVWCTSRPYGLYRIHSAADTAKHVLRATNVRETYLVTHVNLVRVGMRRSDPEATAFRTWLAHRAYRSARKLYARGLTAGSLSQLHWALRLNPTPRALWLWVRTRFRHALASNTAERAR